MNSLIHWDPLFEKLANGFFRTPSGDGSLTQSEWTPLVDIHEDGKQFRLEVEVPGVNKNDIKVQVENGVLTISGERKTQKESGNGQYRRVERSYGSFLRRFDLPEEVDQGNVQAEFKDGLLLLTLPKVQMAQPKTIDIKIN